MSGPGGETVGRVSVKVSPDTGSFANELRRELRAENLDVTVPVKFEFDKDQFRRDLDSIVASVPTITIPVQLGDATGDTTIDVDADTDPAKRAVDEFVAETAARKPKVTVEADVDRSAVDRILANLTAKAKIDVDIDHFNAQMERAFAATENVGRVKVQVDLDRSVFTRVSNAFRDLTDRVGELGRAATSAVTGALGALGTVLSSVTGSLGRVGSAMGVLVGLPALATAIAAGGAAITAAWGTISTAIAAVPAAIALIGAPIGVVMLGMDGIKKAAQALKPEFDRLKQSVSATFEQGLKPVFDQLKGSMDALSPSINAIATQLVGLAQRTADWITQSGGLELIQTLLNNVAGAINGINLNPLLEGFTRLAGNQAALRVITGLIEDVGAALQEIADNPVLDQAFDGLREVIGSLTRAFTDLVNNGIELFNGAWPGLKQGLDGIAEFFNKFDWDALGKSVGQVFQGIGDTLKDIPQSTIDAITKAFKDLGTTFADPAFQEGMRGFADVLPVIVRGLKDLSELGSGIGTVLGPIARFLNDGADGADELSRSLGEEMVRSGKMSQETFEKLHGSARENLTPLPGIGQQAGQGVAQGITGPLVPLPGQVDQAARQIHDALLNPLVPLPGMAGQIMGQVPPAVTVPLAPLPAQVGGIAGAIPPAMQGPLSTLPGVIGPIFGALPGLMTTPIEPLPGIFGAQGHRITAGFGSGIQGMPDTLAQELGLLPPVATTGLQGVVDAVPTGLAGIGPAITAGLAPVKAAFTTGLAGLVTIAQASWTTITAVFQTAWTTIATAVQTGWTTITTIFQTAFPTLTALVQTAWTTITTIFQTTWTTITALIQMAWTTITTTVQTGVQSVITFVQNLGTQVVTILQTAWTNVVTATQNAWNQAVQAVQNGINQVLAAVRALPGQITGALGNLGQTLVAAGRALIDGLLAGIKAGVAAMLSYVRTIASQIAAAKGPRAYDKRLLIPQGGWIMEGLLEGLRGGADDLWSWLHQFTRDLRGTEIGGPRLDLDSWTGGLGRLHAQVSSAVSGAPAPAGPSSLPTTINIYGGQEVNTVQLAELVNFKLRHHGRAGVHAR